MGQRAVADALAGDELAAAVYVALGRLVRSLRQSDPQSEVGPGGISALATLRRGGPVRVGALAEIEGVAPASMTRIVNALESHGLAVREPDPSDGRALVVAATADGEHLLVSGQEAKLAALRRRIDALPDADRTVLAQALPALEQLGVTESVGRS